MNTIQPTSNSANITLRFQRAVIAKNFSEMEELLNSSPDINAVHPVRGEPVLFLAATDLTIVEFLLNNGASVSKAIANLPYNFDVFEDAKIRDILINYLTAEIKSEHQIENIFITLVKAYQERDYDQLVKLNIASDNNCKTNFTQEQIAQINLQRGILLLKLERAEEAAHLFQEAYKFFQASQPNSYHCAAAAFYLGKCHIALQKESTQIILYLQSAAHIYKYLKQFIKAAHAIKTLTDFIIERETEFLAAGMLLKQCSIMLDVINAEDKTEADKDLEIENLITIYEFHLGLLIGFDSGAVAILTIAYKLTAEIYILLGIKQIPADKESVLKSAIFYQRKLIDKLTSNKNRNSDDLTTAETNYCFLYALLENNKKEEAAYFQEKIIPKFDYIVFGNDLPNTPVAIAVNANTQIITADPIASLLSQKAPAKEFTPANITNGALSFSKDLYYKKILKIIQVRKDELIELLANADANYQASIIKNKFIDYFLLIKSYISDYTQQELRGHIVDSYQIYRNFFKLCVEDYKTFEKMINNLINVSNRLAARLTRVTIMEALVEHMYQTVIAGSGLDVVGNVYGKLDKEAPQVHAYKICYSHQIDKDKHPDFQYAFVTSGEAALHGYLKASLAAVRYFSQCEIPWLEELNQFTSEHFVKTAGAFGGLSTYLTIEYINAFYSDIYAAYYSTFLKSEPHSSTEFNAKLEVINNNIEKSFFGPAELYILDLIKPYLIMYRLYCLYNYKKLPKNYELCCVILATPGNFMRHFFSNRKTLIDLKKNYFDLPQKVSLLEATLVYLRESVKSAETTVELRNLFAEIKPHLEDLQSLYATKFEKPKKSSVRKSAPKKNDVSLFELEEIFSRLNLKVTLMSDEKYCYLQCDKESIIESIRVIFSKNGFEITEVAPQKLTIKKEMGRIDYYRIENMLYFHLNPPQFSKLEAPLPSVNTSSEASELKNSFTSALAPSTASVLSDKFRRYTPGLNYSPNSSSISTSSPKVIVSISNKSEYKGKIENRNKAVTIPKKTEFEAWVYPIDPVLLKDISNENNFSFFREIHKHLDELRKLFDEENKAKFTINNIIFHVINIAVGLQKINFSGLQSPFKSPAQINDFRNIITHRLGYLEKNADTLLFNSGNASGITYLLLTYLLPYVNAVLTPSASEQTFIMDFSQHPIYLPLKTNLPQPNHLNLNDNYSKVGCLLKILDAIEDLEKTTDFDEEVMEVVNLGHAARILRDQYHNFSLKFLKNPLIPAYLSDTFKINFPEITEKLKNADVKSSLIDILTEEKLVTLNFRFNFTDTFILCIEIKNRFCHNGINEIPKHLIQLVKNHSLHCKNELAAVFKTFRKFNFFHSNPDLQLDKSVEGKEESNLNQADALPSITPKSN